MTITILPAVEHVPSQVYPHIIPREDAFPAIQVMAAHGWELRFLAAGPLWCTVMIDGNQSLALYMNGMRPLRES